jgi:hypothetical protein
MTRVKEKVSKMVKKLTSDNGSVREMTEEEIKDMNDKVKEEDD